MVISPVDIMDENGTTDLPVKGETWFEHMTMGKSITNYDSLVVLTHFKGHFSGGFGGSNKNIGIGCVDGRIGKKMIHTEEGNTNQFNIKKEELMERITESSKATVDHFGNKKTFINAMRNMSIDCDCTGIKASPVVTPDVGILASRYILDLDQACVDLVFAMGEENNKDLVERMKSRHGFRQLTYMNELGIGNNKYKLIDIDNDEKEISQSEAVKHIKSFQ